MLLKIKIIIPAVLFVLIAAGCRSNMFETPTAGTPAEDELSIKSTVEPEVTLPWEYPVKPGMEQWASFTTGQQMVDALQIPLSILPDLSTNDLVKICMNYPLFIDYLADNNHRRGISYMIEIFNGFKELSLRMDGVHELIRSYIEFPVLDDLPDENSKDYYMPYKLPFLEIFLADDSFINQLDSQMASELEQSVLVKYTKKLEYANVYSLFNVRHTMLLWAVVTDKHNPSAKTPAQLEVVKRFIENYNAEDGDNLLTEISLIMSLL